MVVKKTTRFTVVGGLQIIKDDLKKTVALTHSQGDENKAVEDKDF
jgi:hypothetical protein